jgi:hypothetical protein
VNWVVVLLTGSECEEYPGVMCVMEVLGPYERTRARQVAAAAPKWTRPHIMLLESPGSAVERMADNHPR